MERKSLGYEIQAIPGRLHVLISNDLLQEMLLEWEELMKESDQASRDRLFVLTTAAEKGWSVATELAAGMRGDMADKNLARAVKKIDKKKQ